MAGQTNKCMAATVWTTAATVGKSLELQKRMEKFASVHGLLEQRVYSGLCLAYGSDPVLFADVSDSGLLPKARAGNCEHEYQTFAFAFRSVIRPHIDRQMARAILSTTWFPEPDSR
jgi:Putative metallopeptidase